MLNLSTTRYAASLFLAFTVLVCRSQSITLPRTPSPAATVSQTIGISTVTIDYSRPSVKGRQVWGALVPYGWNKQAFGLGNEAPWRAGANENTVLRLSHPARIEGHLVPAGAYGLFFVINQDNTGEVILSKDSRSWGSFFYDPQHDEMRSKISLRAISNTEILTYDFQNVDANAAELVLNWEKMQFPVKIGFAVDDIVMTNATEELKGPAGFNSLGYSAAANYALQHKINYDQALVWVDKAIVMSPSFAAYSTKSGLLKETGKTSDAESMMKKAIDIASENDLNQYGYTLLNDHQEDKAIEIFILNTQRHPKSANVFDSLGEAYAIKGDKKNAIVNFKKSISLDPSAGVRSNSEKYLKQLGAM
ncbi:MAG TPA: DUF2911 domain-containing protein [Puia sp.]